VRKSEMAGMTLWRKSSREARPGSFTTKSRLYEWGRKATFRFFDPRNISNHNLIYHGHSSLPRTSLVSCAICQGSKYMRQAMSNALVAMCDPKQMVAFPGYCLTVSKVKCGSGRRPEV
jgi:hypothetical protein